MINAKRHAISTQTKEIKPFFHIATNSSENPCLTNITSTNSLYRIVPAQHHDIVGVLCSGLRVKQYKVTVHFHILD